MRQDYINSAVMQQLRQHIGLYDGIIELSDGSQAENPDEIGELLTLALRIPALRDQALSRTEDISEPILQRALVTDPNPYIVDVFVKKLVRAGSYSSADRFVQDGQLALVEPHVSAEQVASLVIGFLENSQLNGSGSVQEPLTELIMARTDIHEELKNSLKDELSVQALYRGMLSSHFNHSSKEKFRQVLEQFLPREEVDTASIA